MGERGRTGKKKIMASPADGGHRIRLILRLSEVMRSAMNTPPLRHVIGSFVHG